MNQHATVGYFKGVVKYKNYRLLNRLQQYNGKVVARPIPLRNLYVKTSTLSKKLQGLTAVPLLPLLQAVLGGKNVLASNITTTCQIESHIRSSNLDIYYHPMDPLKLNSYILKLFIRIFLRLQRSDINVVSITFVLYVVTYVTQVMKPTLVYTRLQ